MNNQVTLNEKQQEAVDEFFKFLFTEDKEFIITGSPGTGKTFLMSYLKDKVVKDYWNTCELMGIEPLIGSIEFTATTNKAASVLAEATAYETSTIHRLLGLKVIENYNTGEVTLERQRNTNIITNTLIFIDECSMINTELYKYINQLTHNCKIVYVGDRYQLAPVKETISPVFRHNISMVELTEPFRNKNQQALIDICNQLKDTVSTGVFKPIQIIPGIIDWFNPTDMQQTIDKEFDKPCLGKRLLAYANKTVIGYNNYILNKRGITEGLAVNEWYVVATSATLINSNGKKHSIPVETECFIKEITNKKTTNILNHNVSFKTVKFTVPHFGEYSAYVADDYSQIMDICKILAKQKRWKEMFHLKEMFIDLRPRDSSTVHKAQGSTLDTVFIDLSDISKCNQPDMAARLLYVAFSRAKDRVVLCGTLKEAYGGLIK